MSKRKVITESVEGLRPHPLNKELYGPPTANSAYKDIKAGMARGGYDERHPLLVTGDGRILWGVTRWAVAKSLGIAEVPCEVYVPSSPETAELEYERELIRGNTYRRKTQLIIAREQRKVLELEKALARRRMGEGSDGGPSKSSDRVGKVFGESGKTVQRRLKVLDAIEEAEADGDRKKMDKLTELLEARQTVKALDLINGPKAAPAKPVKVEVPPTLLAHANKAYSEFFEGCAKAILPAEVEQLSGYLERMRKDLEAARARVAPPPNGPTPTPARRTSNG